MEYKSKCLIIRKKTNIYIQMRYTFLLSTERQRKTHKRSKQKYIETNIRDKSIYLFRFLCNSNTSLKKDRNASY
jgi:hypothetical protein